MRLYVTCRNGSHRIYFQSPAQERGQLPDNFPLTCPIDGSVARFQPSEVTAEPNVGGTAGGAILGGIIGILGGPLGVLLGGALGGTIGGAAERGDHESARRFNGS